MSRFRMIIALAVGIAAASPHIARTAPPAAESPFSRAVREYSAGEWAAAVTEFQRFLASHADSPQAPEATYWLGESLVQLGRLDEADAVFERFARTWPKHSLAPETWFRRGEMAFWAARSVDARTWLERFVDSSDTSRRRYYALVYLAEMAVEREDLPEVESLRNRFLALDRADRQQTGRGAADENVAASTKSRAAAKGPANSPARTAGPHALRPAIDRAWGKALLQAAQYELAAQIFADKRLRTPEDAYYHGVALLGLRQFAAANQRTATVWTNELPNELQPRLLILRASLLIELSRDEEAAAVLDEYLETMPATRDASWARQQRLQIPLKRGRIDEAIAQWLSGTAMDLAPNERGPIGLELAEAAFASGEQAAAERVYRAILAEPQLAASHAAAHVNLGWLAWKRGETSAARDAFANCLASRPNAARLAEAAFGLGQAYERLGDAKAASMAYEQVIARPGVEPQVAPALLALARIYGRQGEHEKAETTYRRLIDEFPHIRQRDAALYGWAWTLVDLARHDEAMRGWQRVTAEFPESPFAADARLRLAEDAFRRRRPPDARKWLDELLARPVDAKLAAHAAYLRGRLAADAGDWAALEVDMRKLIDEAQSPALQHAAEYWVAESLYRRDAWQEALDRFTQLDEWAIADAAAQPATKTRDELDDSSWLAVIPLRRAQLLARQSRWSDAQGVIKSARERFPNFRFAYEWDFIEAQCLAANGRPDEARRAWERVVRSPFGGRSETAAVAQWQIGQSWQLAGQSTEAEEAYAALERLFPSSPWRVRAMLGRAQCLERQQEWEAAVRAYAAIIQEFPVGTWSDQAEAGLREARRAALRIR